MTDHNNCKFWGKDIGQLSIIARSLDKHQRRIKAAINTQNSIASYTTRPISFTSCDTLLLKCGHFNHQLLVYQEDLARTPGQHNIRICPTQRKDASLYIAPTELVTETEAA